MSLTAEAFSLLSHRAVAVAVLALAVLAVPAAGGDRLRRLRPGGSPRRRPKPAIPLLAPRHRPVVGAAVSGVLVLVVGGLPGALPVAVAVAGATWFGVRRRLARRARAPAGAEDALRMAATGDLLAACLRSGMPVSTAIRAVAGTAPPEPEAALRSTAEMLALGAEPDEAWAPAKRCPATAELARAACRTARSGSALAGVGVELAERARASVSDVAESRAARAGVLVTAPLGLCFLPSFLCLGVLPVVLGLADQLTPLS